MSDIYNIDVKDSVNSNISMSEFAGKTLRNFLNKPVGRIGKSSISFPISLFFKYFALR